MHIGRKALEEDDLLSLMYHRVCKYCTNMAVVRQPRIRMTEITLCIGLTWVMLGIICMYVIRTRVHTLLLMIHVRNELKNLPACQLSGLRDQPNLDSIAALSPARFILYMYVHMSKSRAKIYTHTRQLDCSLAIFQTH